MCTCEFWRRIPSLMSPTVARFGPPSYTSLASSFDLSFLDNCFAMWCFFLLFFSCYKFVMCVLFSTNVEMTACCHRPRRRTPSSVRDVAAATCLLDWSRDRGRLLWRPIPVMNPVTSPSCALDSGYWHDNSDRSTSTLQISPWPPATSRDVLHAKRPAYGSWRKINDLFWITTREGDVRYVSNRQDACWTSCRNFLRGCIYCFGYHFHHVVMCSSGVFTRNGLYMVL
jgi:hypothetical protein